MERHKIKVKSRYGGSRIGLVGQREMVIITGEEIKEEINTNITRGLGVEVEKVENVNDICKKCGSKLYAKECLTAGYCEICAVFHKDIRKIWEEKDLAKFCTNCGHILYEKESISTGICYICREMEKLKNRKGKFNRDEGMSEEGISMNDKVYCNIFQKKKYS